MARTTFSGPVVSQNGFEGPFTATQVVFQSNNANTITMDAPTGLAASYTFLLPPNDGNNGQVLTTDGSGVTTWTTNGTGTVTQVSTSGSVNGLTLTGGPITGSGTVTLGGSFALATASAADVAAIANAVNTTGKYTGKMVVDYATGIIYTATGATAGSAWAPSDASGLVTPA
jgi:hypothetical protein